MTLSNALRLVPRRAPRRVLAAALAIAMAMPLAAIFARPSPAAGAQQVAGEEWWSRGMTLAESGSKVVGARAKDLADKKMVNDSLIKADMGKYAIAGYFTLALVVTDIIITLVRDEPTFEELVAERIVDIKEQMHELQVGLDELEKSLEDILDQTHMAEFRTRHQNLDSSATPIRANQEMLDVHTNPELPGSSLALKILSDTITDDVPAARTDIVQKTTGADRIQDAYGQLIKPEFRLDDRESYYRHVVDYLATWDATMSQATDQLANAHAWQMTQSGVSQFDYKTNEAKIEAALTADQSARTDMWAPMGYPLSDDDFVTMGDDTLLARDYENVATGDPLRYEPYDWGALNVVENDDMWDDLKAAAAQGDGDTIKERLADQGLRVPSAIDLKKAGSYQATMWWGTPASMHTATVPCTWVGFTETVTVSSRYSNGVYYMYVDKPITYESGDSACINPAHVKDADATEIPAADLTGSEGAMFDASGMPRLQSNIWWMSGDVPVEVYRNGQLVDTLTERGPYTPGLVQKLTLTTDRADIPGSGWAVLAEGAETWAGLHDGAETATYDLDEGQQSFLSTIAADGAPDGAELTLVAPGEGSIAVFEDGGPIAATASTEAIVLDEDITEVLITGDPEDARRDGVTAVAMPDTGATFHGWYGAGSGTEATMISVDPDGSATLGARMTDEPTPISVDVAGKGVVEVHRDGAPVETLSGSDSFVPEQFVSEITLTRDRNDVPDTGWAALALPEELHELTSWGTPAGDPGTQVLTVPAAGEFELSPTFAPFPNHVSIEAVGPGGVVDLYEDDELVATAGVGESIDEPLVGEKITLTSKRSDVPAKGLAAHAKSTKLSDELGLAVLEGWSGAHEGAETATVPLDPGGRLELTASFAEAPDAIGILRNESRVAGVTPGTATGRLELLGSNAVKAAGAMSLSAYVPDHHDAYSEHTLTVSSLSFRIAESGQIEDAEVSGQLRSLVQDDPWGCPVPPAPCGTETTRQLDAVTGSLDQESRRLTVQLESNGQTQGTLVFQT